MNARAASSLTDAVTGDTVGGWLVGAASTVMVAPWVLVMEPVPAAPPMAAVSAIAGIGVLSTAVAYILYFRILAAAGPTNLLLVTFLIPVSALVLGALFLGERPDAGAFVGMALIFLGLAAVDGRAWARVRAARDARS